MADRDPRRSIFEKFASRHWLHLSLLGTLAVLPLAVYAGSVSGLLAFVNGDVADADAVNANYSDVTNAVNDNDTRVLTLEGLLSQSCPANRFLVGFDAAGAILCNFPDTSALSVATGHALAMNFTPGLLVDQLLVEVLDQWLTDPTISLAIDITGINGGFELHGNDVINVVDTSAFSTDNVVAQTVVDWTTDTVTQNVNEVYTVCVRVRRNTTQLIGVVKCGSFGPF